MHEIILKIDGMSCSACSNGLEKYLNKQKGIISATVNLVLAQALIKYDDSLSLDDLNRFVEEAGFKSLGVYNYQEDKKNNKAVINLIIMAFLAILTMYIAMGHMINLPTIPFININNYPMGYAFILCLLAIIFLGYGHDIIVSGFKNLWHKTPNMDTLVSLGVIASFLYSLVNMYVLFKGNTMYVHHLYFESCVMIIFFIKLGRFIDGKSKDKTKDAIKGLVQITPSLALVKDGDKEREVTIDEVQKGDILICKPGMKIAVDGIVIDGETHLDEAFITGESKPVKKHVNDQVIAGSISYDGYILYRAERIGRDSTISKIVHLVMESANTKAPISRLADKISGYFVPSIMIISVLTFLIYFLFISDLSEALVTAVTVLVVACPCALGLATPLAMVISIGVSAKEGILIKSSATLEMAEKIDTIVFDKTGTLTYGDLKIAKIINHSSYDDDQLLSLVSSLEAKSNHPISHAFNSYQKDHQLKLYNVTNFENIAGIGIKGQIDQSVFYLGNSKLFTLLNIANPNWDEEEITALGASLIYVIENNEVIGLIGVTDIIRSNALKTITKLHKLNKDVIMLTGDNEQTAQLVGQKLGIKHVIAGVLPKEKNDFIKKLIADGKKVCMVGDGINDAPSLALATIGISIHTGTDIANDSSDVILIHDDLEKIPMLINISKHTLRNIKQNLFWAFFYNLCMIPIAIGILKPFGISMNPMLGSLAMMISSLTVVFNSLRLRKLSK